MAPRRSKLKNGLRVLGDNSCDGKPSYSKEEAEELARYNTEKSGWVHNAYYCKKHDAYHFGHAFPRVRIRRR